MDALEFGAWRRRLKLTQEQAAEKLRVSRTTIQNWETGATGIPAALDAACELWEHRIRQEDPKLGPVSLVWADAPMFVQPGTARTRMPMMQQQVFASNAEALGRVVRMWHRSDFENPFIMDETGKPLWNVVELARVVGGDDGRAPTPERWRSNAIAALAGYFRSNSGLSARSGSKMLSAADAAELQRRVERLAGELDALAVQPAVTFEQVEKVLLELRMLGNHAPTELISDVAQAISLCDG